MKFSFVIPAYNAEKTIHRCIDSVLKQDYQEWEIVVIDDGSNDNTFSIIEEYAKNDSRIHAIKQNNCGPGRTRNNAILKTTGDYISFLDSDDYIEENYLSLVKKQVEENGYDIIILDNYYENTDGKIIREENLSLFKDLARRDLISVQMTGKMPWGACRKIAKRKIIMDNEIFFSEDTVGEEALFSFKLFQNANNIGFLGEKVYHYVDYPDSQSKKGKDDPWGPIVNKIRDYLQENNLMDQYEKDISSFAYTALVVAIYRISCNHKFGEAIQLCNKAIETVNQKYCYNMVLKFALEKRVKIILILVKLHLLPCIILMSKFKKLFKR